MLKVERIVNKIFTSNTYIVFDDDYDYCWLIDIGDFEKIADAIPAGMSIRGVFLTHTHFDHIYGINALHRAFPTCKVYTAEYGKEALYDEKKNFSKYHEIPLAYEGEEVIVLKEGQIVELYKDTNIIAYETPGHCASCMSYILNELIFTGDSLIPGVKVVTKLPGGDRTLAKQSKEKIILLSKDRTICPGHREMKRI